jgi:hypothetical protein
MSLARLLRWVHDFITRACADHRSAAVQCMWVSICVLKANVRQHTKT